MVQVIGEMSNKAAPHRKFAQTFVLAEQPNGYFVLNDIFRYISEEEEDEVDTSIAPEPEIPDVVAPEEEPKTLTSSDDPVAQNEHAELVDKKLEEKVVQAPAETTTVEDDTTNEQSMPDVEAEEDATNPIAAASSDNEDKIDAADEEESAAPVAEQDIPAEKPKDPDPTPVASPPKPAKAIPVQDTSVPAAPPKPAAPKTWANLVAANRVASPAVPNATSSTSPSAQPKAAPPPAIPVPAASAPANEDSSAQPQQSPGAGWQTAGHDSGKRQARQQSVSAPSDKSTVLGYVKNVTDKVDASLLKAMLSEYGKLEYFDVSRPKVCSTNSVPSIAYTDLSGRIVHSLSLQTPLDTTPQLPPTHTRLEASRSMSKNAAHGQPLMVEASAAEAECVVAAEDPKAVLRTKDGVASRRTVVVEASFLAVEEGA